MSDKPALVLVGPPAAGKSRLAKRVAKMMNLPLVDTDSMVVQEHGPIKDIFANHGEDVFRAWERAAVITALETPGIVALGGGAVMDPATREDLRNHTIRHGKRVHRNAVISFTLQLHPCGKVIRFVVPFQKFVQAYLAIVVFILFQHLLPDFLNLLF